MPTPQLRDYRDKLTVGTRLGLGYLYNDTAYLATRGTHPVQFTVVQANDDAVVLTQENGHRHTFPWDTSLTYLSFGPGPYPPQRNILAG